jgi:quinol monooxygenase YgiN
MILIAGIIDFIDQAARDGVVAAAAESQASVRNDEPGCLGYSFAADSGVPNRVQVFESWADEASLAAHFQHPNFFAMKEILGGFERLGPSVVQKYRVDLAEGVYDAQRQPRADFFTAAT